MTTITLMRALTLALACAPVALQAQMPATRAGATPIGVTGARTARAGAATVTGAPPVVDGRLTDDAWRAATPLADFTQRDPQEGRPVSERTEVRLLTDGEAPAASTTNAPVSWLSSPSRAVNAESLVRPQ